MSEIVDRCDELVHFQSKKSFQAKKGSFVWLLEGAFRAVDDSILPKVFSSRIKKTNTKVDTAVANVACPKVTVA